VIVTRLPSLRRREERLVRALSFIGRFCGSSARRRGGVSRLGTVLAGWVLLLPLLLPLLAIPVLPAGSEEVPAWARSSLCHVDGASTRPAGDDGRAPGRSSPARPCPFCPACPAWHLAGAVLPPAAIVLALPAEPEGVALAARQPGFLRTSHWATRQPRAPPLIA
jgi:hypothetical protein